MRRSYSCSRIFSVESALYGDLVVTFSATADPGEPPPPKNEVLGETIEASFVKPRVFRRLYSQESCRELNRQERMEDIPDK